MTWTYTGDPANVPLDKIRLLIGDTDENAPLMQDDELLYFSDTFNSNPYLAAAQAARSIAAEYAKKSDKSVGGLSINYSQKYEQYMKLYDDLLSAAAGVLTNPTLPVPVLGGGGRTYLGGNWP